MSTKKSNNSGKYIIVYSYESTIKGKKTKTVCEYYHEMYETALERYVDIVVADSKHVCGLNVTNIKVIVSLFIGNKKHKEITFNNTKTQ